MQKRSGAWYRANPQTWTVVQLQKSQYGQSYYVNVGFWLRVAGDDHPPPEHHFHIRIRLNALLPDPGDEVEELLDLENGIPEPARRERLTQILRDMLQPFLERGSTLAGLRDMHKEGVFQGAAVRGEALTQLNASVA